MKTLTIASLLIAASTFATGCSLDTAEPRDSRTDAVSGGACNTSDECTLDAVPEICMLCDDDTCAEPVPACVDGSCGIDWVCEETNDACEVDADCELDAVPEICMLCDDDTCAEPVPACVDGSCGIDWVCPL